ncbi:MAG: hypothetical protein H6684_11020 [Deltaproteobacteria bacterium]|nr:hypothetical protein [bacterium]MCB9489253.1 hypothetical protein [Deltaproteobacteria bacterium]
MAVLIGISLTACAADDEEKDTGGDISGSLADGYARLSFHVAIVPGEEYDGDEIDCDQCKFHIRKERSDEDRQVTTNVDGRYSVDLKPGEYSLNPARDAEHLVLDALEESTAEECCFAVKGSSSPDDAKAVTLTVGEIEDVEVEVVAICGAECVL